MDAAAELARAYAALAAGDYAGAGAGARSVLQGAPEDPGALTLLGRLALLHGDPIAARDAFSRVLRRWPRTAAVWLDLARSLRDLGLHQDALAAVQRAVALAPADVQAHTLEGEILLVLGERQPAAEAFRRAIGIDPAQAGAFRGLSQVEDLDVAADEVRQMTRRAEDHGLATRARAELHYALAHIYRRAGEDHEFTRHLFAANDLQRQTCPGDRDYYARVFDRLEACFTRETLANAPRADALAPDPIFIVGMPRSGTTLVESVIAAHPDVAAGGELNHMRGPLARSLEGATGRPPPEGFERLPQPFMTDLARGYLRRLAIIGGARSRVTDKTPGNYHLLGLLPILFPGGRIVHVVRDPVATCFSILQYPFDDRAPHTCDVALLAYVYARYVRLMRHWRTLCPSAFIDVQYEHFVDSPAVEGRRIYAYLGLEWHDAYLDHDRRPVTVRTFSSAQVRKPIYRTSVGDWRRYQDALAPLRRALETELSTVGESIECATSGRDGE